MAEPLTVGSLATNQDFLALAPGERIKVIRAVGAQDPEFQALPIPEQDKVAQVMSGVASQPSQGLGAYAKGLALSVPETAIGVGREAVKFGQDVASFPSRWGQAGQIGWRDVLYHPGQVAQAGGQTLKDIFSPLVQAAPEIAGGTIGGLLGGPGGVPLGAGMGREMMGIAQGVPAEERGKQTGAALLTTAVGQRIPQGLEAAGKMPGRYLSLPAERHAAGAAMMEKIPERFGVTDAVVNENYTNAENLYRAAAKVRSEVQVSEQAGGPILDHVRRFREASSEAQRLGEQVDILQRAGQPVPRQLQPALDNAKEAANPKNSTIMRWLTTSPLENFRGTTKGLAAELQSNPIPELQNKALIGKLNKVAGQAQQVSVGGGATAEGVNRIIQAVNAEIGDSMGATRGVWKQVLRSLHDDMRTAAETTGNPAFQSYANAIESARLNFLRQDIQHVIETSGIRNQRTGVSVITNPGAVKQWMQRNPEWMTNVEKAQPGILRSIEADLQEIIPITDITGRATPGVQAGSRRVVMGGASGLLLSKLLGISPYEVAAIGSLIGGFTPGTGFTMSSRYIQRSFQPTTRTSSRVGAGVGALLAPSLGGPRIEE